MRLDAHAIYILRRLRLAGASLPSALPSLETSWRAALASAPEQVAQIIDRGGTWSDLELLAARASRRSASWVPTHEGAPTSARPSRSIASSPPSTPCRPTRSPRSR